MTRSAKFVIGLGILMSVSVVGACWNDVPLTAPALTQAPDGIRYRCTLHSTNFAEGEVGVVIVR